MFCPLLATQLKTRFPECSMQNYQDKPENYSICPISKREGCMFMRNHVLNYLIFYEAGILLLLAHLVRGQGNGHVNNCLEIKSQLGLRVKLRL
jgi:hypothetical protein